MEDYIRSFGQIGLADISLVGGKTASLGELYTIAGRQGLNVPDGFAVTAAAYRDALDAADCRAKLSALLDGLGQAGVRILASRARQARALVHEAADNPTIRAAVMGAYRELEQKHGRNVAV